MPTPFEQFVNIELPRRVSTPVPVGGNLPAGQLARSTGVGLQVEFVDASILNGSSQVIKSLPNGEATAILAGQPVFINATGEAMLASALAADNSTTLKAQVRAIALEEVAPLASGNFLLMGIAAFSSAAWDVLTGDTGGLIAGKDYFLSFAASGELIHDVAVNAPNEGDVVITIGYAVSNTELLLQPRVMVVW